MITDVNYYKKVMKRILIILVTILGIYISFKLAVFYIPFLIAFIISLIIEPLIRKVMKHTTFTRKTCAIITMIAVFGIIIGLLIWGISSAITESTNLLESLNNYVQKVSDYISKIISDFRFDKIEISNEIKTIAESSSQDIIKMLTSVAKKWLTNIVGSVQYLPTFLIYVGITVIATYFVCADKLYILDQMEYHLPQKWVNKIGSHIRNIIDSLGGYLKAQVILIVISFFIVLVGLYIFKMFGFNIEYPLMAALGIGFVDALPILGSGTVMLPWAVISAANGNLKLAIGLIGLYLIIIVTRQLLEPKIVSNHIGIHPIFTLIAMYTGFKLIGILGMFIGPIILIILKNVFSNLIDNGVVKTILDRK